MRRKGKSKKTEAEIKRKQGEANDGTTSRQHSVREGQFIRVITDKPQNFHPMRIFLSPAPTVFLNAFGKLREQAICSRQSILSTGSREISGRTVLLIQSESSYANILRNIRREISRIPSAFRSSNFYTFYSSTRANCVHTICKVENRTNLRQSSPTSSEEIATPI